MAIAPTKLVVARSVAEERIQEQIDKGRKIRNKDIRGPGYLKEARSERDKWRDYNTEMLKGLFNNTSIADEYAKSPSVVFGGFIDTSLAEDVKDFRERMDEPIRKLESILERLELYEEESIPQVQNSLVISNNVFIVHGHDEAAKHDVARLITDLGFAPIILHEQPDGGRTIIEKFEGESSRAGFAVILLTPDDVGGQDNAVGDLKPRARQNVVLEMGYFIGTLGRKNVCLLRKDTVETPSDVLGVLYTPMDESGAWRAKLAREMESAGLKIASEKLKKALYR